jgi:hypothetical protein
MSDRPLHIRHSTRDRLRAGPVVPHKGSGNDAPEQGPNRATTDIVRSCQQAWKAVWPTALEGQRI